MANNSSFNVAELTLQISYRVMVVQILVLIFLSINFLLILTFFKKECFYTTTRYILFAITLVSDSTILFISDFLLLLTFDRFTMQVCLCIIVCVVVFVSLMLTPVTLTAMTLERYVAICMPLHHAELCSTRSTIHCILIIHGLSSVPCIIVLSTFFASAPLNFYSQHKICSLEMFIYSKWQSYVHSAVFQFYFLIMLITIAFSYIEIMKVAKSASGEDKTSSWKGLKTVILHAFQLLLCLIQLWCPFIESTLLHIDFNLYEDVRYINYLMFYLAPRCLSPLIYGLRDDKFFHALKMYACFGLLKRKF